MPNSELLVVSWNLHKGRSLLGWKVWKAVRHWFTTVPADVFFLQEVIAKKISVPWSLDSTLKSDKWYCQATDIAISLKLKLVLGPNVLKPSWRHGNAILTPHPIGIGKSWDISAHRFEKRGLLTVQMIIHNCLISLCCAHLALTRAARLRQMEWIAQWIECTIPDGPLILAGDFNDWKNDSIPIFNKIGMIEVALSLGASGYTFPSFLPKLKLDKMFIRDLYPCEWTNLDNKIAWLSDHRPYIARLNLVT